MLVIPLILIVLVQFAIIILTIWECQDFPWKELIKVQINWEKGLKLGYTGWEIIDSSIQVTFRIVRADFALRQVGGDLILRGDFLLADTNIEMIL